MQRWGPAAIVQLIVHCFEQKPKRITAYETVATAEPFSTYNPRTNRLEYWLKPDKVNEDGLKFDGVCK